MQFIYGIWSTDQEMVNSLELPVARYKVAFKRYVLRNLDNKNPKLVSKHLADGYMANGKFIDGKVKT